MNNTQKEERDKKVLDVLDSVMNKMDGLRYDEIFFITQKIQQTALCELNAVSVDLSKNVSKIRKENNVGYITYPYSRLSAYQIQP